MSARKSVRFLSLILLSATFASPIHVLAQEECESDEAPPVISCPDLTIGTDPGICRGSVETGFRFEGLGVSASDDCEVDWVFCSYTNASGTVVPMNSNTQYDFPEGDTPISCTAGDEYGNEDTCDFYLTVEDQEPPQLGCPPSVIDCCPENDGPTRFCGGGPPSLVDDNCDGLVSRHEICDEIITECGPGEDGEALCTVSATDSAGNVASCSDVPGTLTGTTRYTWDLTKRAYDTETGEDVGSIAVNAGDQFLLNYEIVFHLSSSGAGEASLVDECVWYFDSNLDAGPDPLGSVCADDDDKTVDYAYLIGPFDTSEDCGGVTKYNEAWLTQNSDDGSFLAASEWNVAVNVTCFGCTHSQGYWKTHSYHGPAPFDDTWEFLPESQDRVFFLSGQSYYEVLWTPPSKGNAYYILAHQYIAAELNGLYAATEIAGQDPADGPLLPPEIESSFYQAMDLLSQYTPQEVEEFKGRNKANRDQFTNLAEVLDEFNSGLIGPGACSEDGL